MAERTTGLRWRTGCRGIAQRSSYDTIPYLPRCPAQSADQLKLQMGGKVRRRSESTRPSRVPAPTANGPGSTADANRKFVQMDINLAGADANSPGARDGRVDRLIAQSAQTLDQMQGDHPGRALTERARHRWSVEDVHLPPATPSLAKVQSISQGRSRRRKGNACPPPQTRAGNPAGRISPPNPSCRRAYAIPRIKHSPRLPAIGLACLLDKMPVLLLDEPAQTIWLRSCT